MNTHTTIAMDPVCLIRAVQFIQKEMSDEVLLFAAHVHGCFECREYLRELGRLLSHRDRIAQRLEARADFGLQWLDSVVRVIGCPFVFARLGSRKRWMDPRGPFEKGRKAGDRPIGGLRR
jgi:hypothetical protein